MKKGVLIAYWKPSTSRLNHLQFHLEKREEPHPFRGRRGNKSEQHEINWSRKIDDAPTGMVSFCCGKPTLNHTQTHTHAGSISHTSTPPPHRREKPSSISQFLSPCRCLTWHMCVLLDHTSIKIMYFSGPLPQLDATASWPSGTNGCPCCAPWSLVLVY